MSRAIAKYVFTDARRCLWFATIDVAAARIFRRIRERKRTISCGQPPLFYVIVYVNIAFRTNASERLRADGLAPIASGLFNVDSRLFPVIGLALQLPFLLSSPPPFFSSNYG